jgi:hypothetical protein
LSIPQELTPSGKKYDIKDILDLKNDSDIVNFYQGDSIENAQAFNDYIEANSSVNKPIVLTKVQILALISKLSLKLTHCGLDALPMLCIGKDCIRWTSCSLQLSGVSVPLGERCPIEISEIATHIKRLANDLDEMPTYSDQLMVQGVAACELLKSRIFADMSSNPRILISVGKGVDKRGNAITETVGNPNHELWSQINRTEERLLKGLHMTLEQRKKANMAVNQKNTHTLRAMYKERLVQLKKKQSLLNVTIDADRYKVTKEIKVDEKVFSEPRGESVQPADSSESNITDNGTTGNNKRVYTNMERSEARIRQINERRNRNGEQNTGGAAKSGGDEGTDDTVTGPDADSLEAIF